MATKPTQFEGPIPGQSLTTEPKNVPWEQPSQHADPMDALEMYMKRLSEPDTMDELVDMLDIGIPISVVTNAMLSGGVMDGMHSVDTKILLKGVIATQIQTIADVVGVDYKMSMTDYDDMDAQKEALMKQKLAVKLNIAIEKGNASDPGVALQQDVLEGLDAPQTEDGMMETPEIEKVEETQEDMPMGIMAKEV